MKFTLEIELGDGMLTLLEVRDAIDMSIWNVAEAGEGLRAAITSAAVGQIPATISDANGKTVGRWEVKDATPTEPPINAPVHHVFCSCHLCQDWRDRQPKRCTCGRVLTACAYYHAMDPDATGHADFVEGEAAAGHTSACASRHPFGACSCGLAEEELIAELEAARDGYVSGAPDGTETPDPKGWAWWYPEDAAELNRLTTRRDLQAMTRKLVDIAERGQVKNATAAPTTSAAEIAQAWGDTFQQHNLLSTATAEERNAFIKRSLDAYNRIACPVLDATGHAAHGALLSADEIAKDRAALTAEEREAFERAWPTRNE